MSVSIKDNKETSIINIVIEKKDYENKVSSILNDYRKRANIPGFRKGFVPMGMIKKQYEIPVKVDEINKVVQKNYQNSLMKTRFLYWVLQSLLKMKK
jgi:trigger factor